MLSLVTSALALTVGVGPIISSSARAPAVSMVQGCSPQGIFGKLPDSVSMAGAVPVFVGSDGTKVDGYSGESTPVRKGFASEFVYGPRTSMGEALGCVIKVVDSK